MVAMPTVDGLALVPGANRIRAPVDWVDSPARLDISISCPFGVSDRHEPDLVTKDVPKSRETEKFARGNGSIARKLLVFDSWHQEHVDPSICYSMLRDA